MCYTCRLSAYFFFFFSSRRRHTRFKCDWSSDVCSSDLIHRRMSTPMNTCGDCAKVGNEPGLLGYKSLYLSVRELWRIIKASCESKEPHACAWRPIADLSDDTWGGSRQTGSKW